MPHEAVRPAFASVERTPVLRLDRFRPDRWSGVIHLRWVIERQSPVAIGIGRLTVRTWTEGRATRQKIGKKIVTIPPVEHHEVVAEIVRRGAARTPVLPGSSLKGAVRQAFELLSPSCNPLSPGRCQVGQKEAQPEVCPACSLFGGQGLAGRLAFLEAVPVPKSEQVLPAKVPRGWGKQKPIAGTFRIYGPGKARDRDGNFAREDEKTWSVFGTFRSRLRLHNASDDELGLLFAALGLGADVSPGLRLGGRKFHGFGACQVVVEKVVPRRPPGPATEGEAAQAWAADLARAALARHDVRRQAFDALHHTLAGKGAAP